MKTILPVLLWPFLFITILPAHAYDYNHVTRYSYLKTVMKQRQQPVYYTINGTEKRTIKTFTPTKTGNLRCVETHDVYGEEYKMFVLTKPLYKYCSVIFFDDTSKWPTTVSRGYFYKKDEDRDIDEVYARNPSLLVVENKKRPFDLKQLFNEGYREYICKTQHCNVPTANVSELLKYNRLADVVGGRRLSRAELDSILNSTYVGDL